MIEVVVDVFPLSNALDGVRILLNGEALRRLCEEMDIALVSDSLFTPGGLGEESHLLRSTAALERLLRLREYGLAAFEVIPEPSHLHCIVEAVHRSDWLVVVFDCFLGSWNQVVSQFNSRTDDKPVVGEGRAVGGSEPVVIWVQFGDEVLMPVNALFHKISVVSFDKSFDLAVRPHSACGVCEARLVVMRSVAVKNGDITSLEGARVDEL